MDAAYKQKEMNTYKIAVQLEQLLKKGPPGMTEEWLQRLDLIEQQIQTRKFRMAVVGEFNRGKSSFINVLLGKHILPEDVLATTATINRVTYGEKPRACVIMKDGSCGNREIAVEELADYVTKLTESAARTAAGIKEVVVEYPTMLCYNDVDLIDTPGMNDMDDMNAITVNQLEDIDLAVVAINAQYPYSETENRFVIKLLESKKVCQIIFVITHFDMIRDREKKKLMDFLNSRIRNSVAEELGKHYKPEDWIFQKYHDIFDDLHLYGISSKDAMDALDSNDMELYETSGFLQLSRELPQVILSSKSINMMDNIVTLLEEIIGEYKKRLQENQNEWKQWQVLEQCLCSLFGLELQELKELAESAVNSDELKQAAEQQKQETVINLLNSLGSIKRMTLNDVHEAMLPVMQQEFKRINDYYRDRKREIFQTVCKQKWPSSLGHLIGTVNDKINQFPMLKIKLKMESDKLERLPAACLADDGFGGAALDEVGFYWLESPIQAVLQTSGNQSVLPGIKRIVDASMEDCRNRIENNINNAFAESISLIKNSLESFLKVFNELINQQKSGNVEENPHMSELCMLQAECDVLHSQIRHGE